MGTQDQLMARCKTCPWTETSWEIRTCPSHRKITIRLRHGMTLTFRVCTHVKDLVHWSQKVLFIGYICLKSEATQAELFHGKVQVCAHYALCTDFLTARLGIYMCQIF